MSGGNLRGSISCSEEIMSGGNLSGVYHFYTMAVTAATIYTICMYYLHDWEGNTGKYSIQDRPYRPDQREGRYRGQERNISPYCPTRGMQ